MVMSDMHKRIGLGSGAVILLTALFLMQGCQQYGTVSPKTYELASALYSVCNRQDVERLPVVDGLINEAQMAAEITDSEANWLREIVSSARVNDWESAMQSARTMMAEQVQH
ncbi:MAG: hypothetical protein Fues2KO_20880 [Fuerstiella sp.]